MVTHKEALNVARADVLDKSLSMSSFMTVEDLLDEQDTMMMRAYLDARGLVMVPRDGLEQILRCVHLEYVPNALFEKFRSLAAAPDPFKEAAP